MRRIWIEILNEVIAAKDTITLSLKLSRNSITITIGNYKKTIKKYPHLNTIENLIHRLSDAGCTINTIYNQSDTDNSTEEWIYIINKPVGLTAYAKSTFLYNLDNGVEVEYINGEYTGNIIPKQTGGITQQVVIENDEHIVRIDINSIDDQFVGVITIREILKNSISAPRIIDLIYKRNSVNIDKFRYEIKSNDYTTDETNKMLTLLRLYTYYL